MVLARVWRVARDGMLMVRAPTLQLWFYFTVKYTNGIELLVLRSILALLLPDMNTIVPGLQNRPRG